MTPIHCGEAAEWVAARIVGGHRGFGEKQAIGVFHGDRIVAGVVYHNWCPEWRCIELTCAAEDRRWLTRPVVHAILEYPFQFCGMVMAQHEVDSPARSIWLRIGADETIIPGQRNGRDNVVATLTKDRWQAGRFFMRTHDGQA